MKKLYELTHHDKTTKEPTYPGEKTRKTILPAKPDGFENSVTEHPEKCVTQLELGRRKQANAEQIRDAQYNVGAHQRAVKTQVDGNSNPKKRTANSFGIKE
jgi:hypothetical protein